MRFTSDERDALRDMLLASERVAEVFEESSPWGIAGGEVALRLSQTLRAERREQPHQLHGEDLAPSP